MNDTKPSYLFIMLSLPCNTIDKNGNDTPNLHVLEWLMIGIQKVQVQFLVGYHVHSFPLQIFIAHPFLLHLVTYKFIL